MRKVASAFLGLAIVSGLYSCGSNVVQPAIKADGNETQTSEESSEVGIVYASNSKSKLFTRQLKNGTFDFKIWRQDLLTGVVKPLALPIPSDSLVIGAAMDEVTAYVAARVTENAQERDVFFRINLKDGEIQKVLTSSPEEFVGTEINSLILEDNILRFFALRSLPVNNGFETELGLFRLEGQKVVAIDSDSSEGVKFNQKLLQSESRNLSAQRIRVQAVATFLRFPKTLASHRTSGSTAHNNQDLHAADLNRGGGDDDLNDGVVAAQSGQVVSSSNVGAGYGEYITILHSNGLTTAYAHLAKRVVSAGANVYSGQYIGNVGKSGGQPSAHLHFVLRNGTNPRQIASPTYPMATSAPGYPCPLTQDMPFSNTLDFGPASC